LRYVDAITWGSNKVAFSGALPHATSKHVSIKGITFPKVSRTPRWSEWLRWTVFVHVRHDGHDRVISRTEANHSNPKVFMPKRGRLNGLGRTLQVAMVNDGMYLGIVQDQKDGAV